MEKVTADTKDSDMDESANATTQNITAEDSEREIEEAADNALFAQLYDSSNKDSKSSDEDSKEEDTKESAKNEEADTQEYKIPYSVAEDGTITASLKVYGETIERKYTPEQLIADLQKSQAASKQIGEAKKAREEADALKATYENAVKFQDAWEKDPIEGLKLLALTDPERFETAITRLNGGDVKEPPADDPYANLRETMEEGSPAEIMLSMLEQEKQRSASLQLKVEQIEKESKQAKEVAWANAAFNKLSKLSQNWEQMAPSNGLPSWDQDEFLDFMQTQPDPFDFDSGFKTYSKIKIDPEALRASTEREMLAKLKTRNNLSLPGPSGRIGKIQQSSISSNELYSKDSDKLFSIDALFRR